MLLIGIKFQKEKPQKISVEMLRCNIMCNIIHKQFNKTNVNQLKEQYMFDFAKQTKQFEELAERIKEVNEFWMNIIKSNFEDFTKPKKK
jgi:myosin-crossreactive antigen